MGSFFRKGDKNEYEIQESELEQMKIVCPECSRIPTLFEIHSDNEDIEFQCDCDKKSILCYKMKKYYEKIKTKADKENKGNKNETNENVKIYYCKNCEKYLKEKNGHDQEHKIEEKDYKFLKEKIQNKNEKLCNMIKVNQIVLNTFENYFYFWNIYYYFLKKFSRFLY